MLLVHPRESRGCVCFVEISLVKISTQDFEVNVKFALVMRDGRDMNLKKERLSLINAVIVEQKILLISI